MTHWTTRIIGNPAAATRTILCDDHVAGNIGAWTEPESLRLISHFLRTQEVGEATRGPVGPRGERLICYWIGREFWGRGIASAAVRQFLPSETTRPLAARVAKHNLGSIRVLEKTGFTRAGEDAFTPPGGTRFEEFIYVLPA